MGVRYERWVGLGWIGRRREGDGASYLQCLIHPTVGPVFLYQNFVFTHHQASIVLESLRSERLEGFPCPVSILAKLPCSIRRLNFGSLILPKVMVLVWYLVQREKVLAGCKCLLRCWKLARMGKREGSHRFLQVENPTIHSWACPSMILSLLRPYWDLKYVYPRLAVPIPHAITIR